MSHLGINANMWNTISRVNPNDGIRYAYIARNRYAPNCNPSVLWSGCFFIQGQNFDPGETFEFLNGSLQVGQFVSVYYPNQSTQCLEILKIIDEAEFNSGLGIMNCPSDFTNAHGTFNGCPCNVIYGDLGAGHYYGAGNPVIFYDCNTCITSVVNQDVSGCTDTLASNYNATATIDDGSCIYKWKCDLDAQGNPTGNPCYIDPMGTWNNQTDCNKFCQIPPDDCDCLPILGTGHTGTAGGINPGYFDYTAYTLCMSACCGPDIRVPDCAIYLADKDYGIKYYDHAANQAYNILQSSQPLATDYDIAAMEEYLWIYNNNVIEEYYAANPNIANYVLNRTLSTGGIALGKGLRAKGPALLGSTQLFSAGFNLALIDFPLPPQAGGPPVANPAIATTTINVTQLFPLPNGMKCLGDIMHDPVSNNLLIAYGSPSEPPTQQFLGVFTMAGNLIDEKEINTTVLGFDLEEWVDGIYGWIPGPNSCRIYMVTNLGNIYQIQQTPYLQISPFIQSVLPTAGEFISYIKGATTRSDMHCNCRIESPPTYDCVDVPAFACIDPGNGTGFYTGSTALADCQQDCLPPQTTWECSPAAYINNCSGATQQLPYPLVNNATTAMDYIANSINGLQQSSFNTITWGMPPYQTTLSVCTGSQGEYLHRIAFIRHPQVFGNVPYYTWDSFLFAAVLSGAIPAPLSGLQNSSFLQVNNLFYQHTNSYIAVLVGKPCLCYTTDCYCYEIQGTTGTYASQAQCIPPCCEVEDGYQCEQGMGCFPCIGAGCPFTGPTALQDCQAACPIQHYYDCDDLGYCVGLLNGVWGPYTTYQQCLLNCPGEDKPCDKCCRDDAGALIQLAPWLDPCKCPIGWTEVECDSHEPCVQNVSCAQGYHWSWVECRCVCTQNVSCAPGYSWSYDTCKCEPIVIGPHDDDHVLQALVGGEGEIIVKVAEYIGKPVQEVTFELYKVIEELEFLRRGNDSENNAKRCLGCGGTDESIAICFFTGCLSYVKYKKDGSGILKWVPNETYGAKTYNCVNGTCIEIDGDWGLYSSYNDCATDCGDIGPGGKLPTNRNLLPQDLTPIKESTDVGVYTSPTTRTVTQRYESQKIINPINGEYQIACTPTEGASSKSYDSLEACMESGDGGWLINNIMTPLNFFGTTLGVKKYTAIPYCCQSYITTTTEKLTVESCTENCFDNDTWWPLFNMDGVNIRTQSNLSYLNNEIPSLVNSKLLTATKDIQQYKNNGFRPVNIFSNNTIRSVDGTIIGYIDGKAVYNTIDGALNQAKTEGCSGYHEHVINNVLGYMACKSHTPNSEVGPREVEDTGTSGGRITAGGPCICRQYLTGPDGISKCVKWSPPGCGDAPFMTSNGPRMIDTPRTTTPTRTTGGGGMSSGGGMSGGGGY